MGLCLVRWTASSRFTEVCYGTFSLQTLSWETEDQRTVGVSVVVVVVAAAAAVPVVVVVVVVDPGV